MKEFFHGWRRKMGVATLVMALSLTGLWVRSQCMIDDLWYLPEGAPCHSLTLSPFGIRWVRSDARLINAPHYHWEAAAYTKQGRGGLDELVWTYWEYDRVWDWNQNGFHFVLLARWDRGISEGSGPLLTPLMIGVWIVPFWSVVMPVALLSAYLLLVPSRKRLPTTSQPHA